MHEFNRRIHVLKRERERKGKARLLALHRPELHIRAPDREFTEGLNGLWSAMGKNGWFPLKNREPSAEGICNSIWCKPPCTLRKTHTFNTLTVRVVSGDEERTRRLTATILHGTARRTEVHYCSHQNANEEIPRENDRNRNRRANMAASWR